MSVTITKSFGRLAELPAAAITTAVLNDMGDLAIRLIRQRTERGVDVDGHAFQPLSEGYRRAKTAAGLSGQADLTVSGRMLNDLTRRAGRGFVDLRFASRGGHATGSTFIQRSRAVGAADKAWFHHVAGAGRSRVRRKFFDLSDKETAVIEARVLRALDRVL